MASDSATKRLREAMTERGVNGRQLADMIGVDYRQMRNAVYRCRRSRPILSKIEKLFGRPIWSTPSNLLPNASVRPRRSPKTTLPA